MSITRYLFIVIKLLLFNRIYSLSKNNSRNLDNSQLYSIKNDSNIKRNLEEEYRPIKIYFDTYDMVKYSLRQQIYSDIRKLISDALDATKATIEKLIMVKKDASKVNPTDYKNEISSKVEKESDFDKEDADLVICVDYVNSLENYYNCSETPIIIKGDKENRPTIGFFRINSDKVSKMTEDFSKKRIL